MKWFRRHQSTEEDKATLEQAQRMRRLAEKRLREAQQAAREVRDVTVEARLIREENQFSRRLSEVFESRPQTND